MQTANLLKKTLLLGRTEGKRRRWKRMVRWLDGVTDSMDMNLLPCPTLCDPIDCSLQASLVHRILQAKYWSG